MTLLASSIVRGPCYLYLGALQPVLASVEMKTDTETPKHRKKRKPGTFVIEYRGAGTWQKFLPKWRTWNRYRTEADRDKALAALRCKCGVYEHRERVE